MRTVRIIAVPAFLLSLAIVADGVRAGELDQFNALESFRMTSGESYEGDLYVFAASSSVSGTIDGDLTLWTTTADIDGTVNGDLMVGANQVNVAGQVHDTVRAFAGTVIVDGTIDGDLLAFAAVVKIRPGAHIMGNVLICGGMAGIDGTIDGDLSVMAGEFELAGTVGRDVHVQADAVRLASAARVRGDMTYESRKVLEMEDGAAVDGELSYEERKKKKDDGGGFFSAGWWIWSTLSAMLVGLVLVALFRRFVPTVTGAIGGEAMMGALIGFGAFLVVPAASLLAIVLVVSLPLGVLGLMLFLVAVYLAKMPVAVWVGERLMKMAGRSAPSPYAAIVLGLLALNLLFAIPYLGKLVWLVAMWLGLGAAILATRTRLAERAA